MILDSDEVTRGAIVDVGADCSDGRLRALRSLASHDS